MESTIPLHQVRTVVRNTSPPCPNRPVFRNDPSLPADQDRISLNLQTWKNVLSEPINTETLARKGIDKILTYFVNIASLNDLANIPAVQTIRESLSILRRGGDFSRDAAKKNWRERIAQLSAAKTNHDPLSSLRTLAIDGFPIFNIWDRMSFIYTVCATDVKTQLGAELHLYQFRMIIKALRGCQEWFSSFSGPTTVAASWKDETQTQGIAIAFATTAVGEPRTADKTDFCSSTRLYDGPDRKTQERVYQEEYAICSESSRKLSRVFDLARCLSSSRKVQSLCFNMNLESSAYQCCGHCERTLEKLGANNIQIDDLWKTALLSTGAIDDEEPYPSRGLKSQKDILKEYGGLRDL
jgi:hypothetical protein